MALRKKSLFLYGFQVTELNAAIDFRAALAGPILMGTLNLGFYSLTGLLEEISRAMRAADPTKVYTATADRDVAGGLENRVTIATSGTYLDLLFGSGPRAASSIRTLIGFLPSDRTGATNYQGAASAGTVLVPTLLGYNYKPPFTMRKNFGSVNVSASGVKETITWQIQQFFQVEFKHEPEERIESEWTPFMDWAVKQRGLEFTPNISSPNTFYEATLESTDADGQGLSYDMREEIPQMPFHYTTGILKFRRRST